MNISKYKHFIWDWNGTLINDTWLCVEITNDMLVKRNLQKITLDDYRTHFDFPVIEYYRRLGFDLENEPFDDIGTEFISGYQKRRLECNLFSKALDVLKIVNNCGIGQSILSAYEQNMLKEIVSHFEIGSFFESINGLADHSASSKIDRGKDLIGNLPYESNDVLLIGDTVHDFEVAESLGVNCLLVASGHHPKLKLDSCGVKVVDSLDCLDFGRE